MNLKKLKAAESAFLDKHPGGFLSEEMQALGKKHLMEFVGS